MTAPSIDPAEKDRLMSKAYNQAQKDLREKHKPEFDGYYQQRCAEAGIEWVPRKSKEDVALDQITELLTQFPELGDKLAQRLSGLD